MRSCHCLGHKQLLLPLPSRVALQSSHRSSLSGRSIHFPEFSKASGVKGIALWRPRAVEQYKQSLKVNCLTGNVGEEDEFLRAVRAVERACQLCLNVRSKLKGFEDGGKGDGRLEKGDQTPVTIADFAVQALITLELGTKFPFPLVGEEDASQLRAAMAEDVAPSSPEGAHHESRSDSPLLQAVVEEVKRAASPEIANRISVSVVLDALDGRVQGGYAGSEREANCSTYWVLDPIDGTRGFLRGGDAQYVVGLALVRDGSLVLGVMGCPNLPLDAENLPSLRDNTRPPRKRGAIIAAAAGRGTWLWPLESSPKERRRTIPGCGPGGGDDTLEEMGRVRRVHVTAETELWDARICISDHEIWEELPLSRSWGGAGNPDQLPLCCGSLCKYAAVAVGAASVFVQHPLPGKPKLKVWDHAAGVICVTEAGGSVTDFSGDELDLANGGEQEFSPSGEGVVVSNGLVHSRVLQELVESLA